jgi:hypothetical protein
MAVLLIIGVVFVAAFAMFLSLNVRKRERLAGTATIMGQFAAHNGWRFGRFEPNLPARAPHITELVGAVRIFVDFQLDGALHGVAFQAFQVRRPPPRGSASTYTPEYTAVLVPRPVAGPELLLAPQRLSWTTVFRRDLQVGDPAFDAAFHVTSQVPAFAAHVLRPPLTTWLTADARAHHVMIVFERNELMAVTRGPLTPETAMAVAGLMTELHLRIPWQQLVG